MQLLDDLRREHERIDAVLGSLRTWARCFAAGEAPLSNRDAFLTFFSVYAGAFHHEREEELLLPALARSAGLAADRGPIAVILEDHRVMAELLRAIATTSDPVLLQEAALRYSHALWQHIDVENSILFPESEDRLRRTGVRELDARAITPMEQAAAATGDALIAQYPPIEPDLTRGDGCVMCHAYGDTCRGLEREWWNEWEWEEMSEHIAAG